MNKWHINLRGLFNAKAILVEEQGFYLTESWVEGDKGVLNFPKDIYPKVNVIARLGFEHTYYDVAVQHVSHYAMLSISTSSRDMRRVQYFFNIITRRFGVVAQFRVSSTSQIDLIKIIYIGLEYLIQ